ncbi:MAG TPA: SIR2 family protein [Thermoanaerobaculia bacterium]|nr:SIR2 family protein [Thermoanaerobaculia bacterium]
MSGFIDRLKELDRFPNKELSVEADVLGRELIGPLPFTFRMDERKLGDFDLELLLSRLEMQSDLDAIDARRKSGKPELSMASVLSTSPQRDAASSRHSIASYIQMIYGSLPPNADEVLRRVHIKFLKRLHSLSGEPLEVFTTNYDPSIEKVGVLDPSLKVAQGFEPNADEGVMVFSDQAFEGPEPIRLYHIHGTFHWQEDRGRIISVPVTHSRSLGKVLLPGPRKAVDAALPPFKSLYARFFEKVREADRIISIGYSGRDEDVTYRLLLGMGANPDSRLIVVMPGKPAFGWLTAKEILGDRFIHLPLKFEDLVDDPDFWRLVEN